jgi:hypothetical protein
MAEKDGAWIGDAKGIAGVDINQNQHYLKCDTNGVLDVNATITSIFGPIDVIVDNIVPVTQSGAWTVAINNFPSVQAVSQSGLWTTGRTWTLSSSTDSVNVGNFPSSFPVTGTVTVLQGTNPWVTSVSNFPATQPVSIAGTVNVNVTNTVPVTLTSTTITGNVTVVQPTGSNLNVAVSNFPATQAISAASLPLPTGAATSANQTNGSQITQSIPLDGNKATYSTGVNALAVATGTTDIFTITGSATKTIRLLQVGVSATQTASANSELTLLRRSTANSGGTFTSPVITPHDTNNAAATATVRAYTAVPTIGTFAGNIRTAKNFANAPAVGASTVTTWTFGNRPGQAVVLRGTSQVIAVSLDISNGAGGSFDVYMEWTEE